MPKRRKQRRAMTSALTIVRAARAAAKNALDSLREEIRNTATKLEKLVTEERSFKSDLFGAGPTERRGRGAPAGKVKRPRATRKGPPQAEKFFKKLGDAFTLDEVRKVAGPQTGISLAQWSRAKRIRKVGKGYQKIAA